jgi:hypothetical protein
MLGRVCVCVFVCVCVAQPGDIQSVMSLIEKIIAFVPTKSTAFTSSLP